MIVKEKPKETETNRIYFPFNKFSSVCACHSKQVENKNYVFVPINGNKQKVVLIYLKQT